MGGYGFAPSIREKGKVKRDRQRKKVVPALIELREL